MNPTRIATTAAAIGAAIVLALATSGAGLSFAEYHDMRQPATGTVNLAEYHDLRVPR